MINKNFSKSESAVRLNRAIASHGICSRRKADLLIFGGQVKVNNVCELNPARRVKSDDLIEINGQRLKKRPPLIYLMMNKPIQTVCTVQDPDGRPTIMDYIPGEYLPARLYPVGRLDYFSEGLLILTNDGEMAHHLMHPSFNLAKGYEVIIRGFVQPKILKAMRDGVVLDSGKKLFPVTVKNQQLFDGNTRLFITLYQGINRQIRRMCEKFNLTILKLKRVTEGPLSLGNLHVGHVRTLTDNEIVLLKRSTGLSTT